jgi:NO-binding membrane sensor protein with MHYT domain
MWAMQMSGSMHHNTTIVGVSLIIAIVASIAALWIAFTMRKTWQKLVSAFVMGVAVCGMHYTAMQGMTIAHAHDSAFMTTSTILPTELAGYIVVATVGVLAVALLSTFAKELRTA